MPERDLSYKKYLDPSVVSKLKTLELKARMVVEGFMVGLHKSPYHGFSVEFSEHRPYMQGDQIKYIDWKVYAKREKFFIKQYEEETNLTCHVIFDVSRSMNYKGKGAVTKFEYGKMLASSLIYLMINQQDSTGLTLYSDTIDKYLPPRSSRIYLRELLKALDSVVPSDATRTGECLNRAAENIKGRGLVVIISDFFDDPDSILSALKRLHYKKNEVIIFQLIDPQERDFSFGEDAVFVDMETNEEMTSQPYQVQKAYQEEFAKFLEKLKKESLNFGIEYNLVVTDEPFDKALLSYFKKRSHLH